MRHTRAATSDRRQEHLDWLALVDVSGPFLTLPVLLRVWPSLEAIDRPAREALTVAHADGQDNREAWIDWVLNGLLGWGDALHRDGLADLGADVPEHDRRIEPTFVLRDAGNGVPRLLGLELPAGTHPTKRISGEAWAATPVDRMAQLCRSHGVELGLVTDARWWALVWAPRGGVTTSAVFDSATWPESADRVVVRAFKSLLERPRFFAVADPDALPALFRESVNNQEEVTETLGVQVRRAVELLVEAIGRDDVRSREDGGRGLDGLATAHDIYRAAVSVMMRTVFLLFAEERGLLPADNPLYEAAYSAGRLCDDLEQRVSEVSEAELEHSSAAWQRLLALFRAVYGGVNHPRLQLPAYDGSIFDPETHPWLETVTVDDRTVLQMLLSVQYVTIRRERRRLSFRALDVEQIGYVYEGLLSFEAFRADQVIVGLVGKAGLEEEVSLADLQARAGRHPTTAELAAAVADKYKDSQVGTARALEKRLAPVEGAAEVEALRLLLAATGGNRQLADRLMPFFGLLRRDLRGLPTVIQAGSLYVTQSALRKNTGTHYTPRFLAEQIVVGALEPLVYSPGPLQTADRNAWRLRSSTDLLALRVADIAMGSGAFLVAACRYLADRLVESWLAEGDKRAIDYVARDADAAADAEVDPVVIDARREIIQHCLYGVDINPMAVEMAKLSLWLVSMDPHRPFTFLDDRLIAGDSLLGVTSLEQIEAMHVDPAKGRSQLDLVGVTELAGVRQLVAETANERRKLTGMAGNSLGDLNEKRRLLDAVESKTERARLFADLVVGAALASAGRGDRALRDNTVAAADHARRASDGLPDAADSARHKAERWLATDQPGGGFDRTPLHWPLVFPEVFERGGFDAIVGNPPFLGGQRLTAAFGDAYREHLVDVVARGARGSADLIAYMVLRVQSLLHKFGQAGLIAKNTLAEAVSREVSLDQLLADGVVIRQAVKTKRWPSRSAALQYCAIWTCRIPSVQRLLDGKVVRAITASLDAESRVAGVPFKLRENRRVAFQGTITLSQGFNVEEHRARELIALDPRYSEVLFPYLNGHDLTSRPDYSAGRWVINFHDWPQQRAAAYVECFDQVVNLVRPDRAGNNRASRRERWWQYAERAPSLYAAIASYERVIAMVRVSKTVVPVMIPTGQVISNRVVVFASDDSALLAVISSAPHHAWAIKYSTAHGGAGDPTYTPERCFETFARPAFTDELRAFGERLDSYRRELMLARQAGLTATYNLVHDSRCTDDDISELRRIHTAIDEAVARAYEWDDLDLDHGFHDTRQGQRYTVGAVARQEILDRLLELNHLRYAAEQAAGAGAGSPVQEELDLSDEEEE